MTTIDRRYSVAEGTAVKVPCRLATTANITLSGLQAIDGKMTAERDRILVKDQADQTLNGIYSASTGDWTRTRDFDGAFDIVEGTRVYVHSGDTHAGVEFVVTSPEPIVIGESALTFGSITSVAVAAAVVAGAAKDAAEAAQEVAEAVLEAVQSAAVNLTNVGHGKILGRNSAGTGDAEQITVPLFQCQLVLDDSNLKLIRKDGCYVMIDGRLEIIPDDGVTIGVINFSADQLRYIYAKMVAGTMALEAVTTGYAAHPDHGYPVMSGDASKTLVGMARSNNIPAFVDSDVRRYVRSYYNDPGSALKSHFTTNRSVTSTGYTEINSEIRIAFIVWAGEVVQFGASGGQSNTNGGSTVQTAIAIDGVTDEAFSFASAPTAATPQPLGLSLIKRGLSEGYHYATLMGAVSSNTGSWIGAGTPGTRCSLQAHLRR